MKWRSIHLTTRRPNAQGSPVRDSLAGARLNAALLLASTINGDGNIELPERDRDGRISKVVYDLDGEGNFRRWRDGVRGDFDMLAFSESVNLLFGDNTPEIFRIEPSGDGIGVDHTLSDPTSEQRRYETIRNAFNVYLIAYEEHLV